MPGRCSEPCDQVHNTNKAPAPLCGSLPCRYNGDTDPGINSMVTQDKFFGYFDSIGVKETEAWRPWTLDGKQRMGGYVVSLEGNFHYLTIRGSGHMVPE